MVRGPKKGRGKDNKSDAPGLVKNPAPLGEVSEYDLEEEPVLELTSVGDTPSYQLARELSQGFHGRDARKVTVVREKFRYYKNLGDLGWLEMFEILHPDGDQYQELEFPEQKFSLSGTPDRKQLQVIARAGERLTIDLDAFPWLTQKEKQKPKVAIGYILAVGYFTDKHHLEGPKYQKDGAPYRHEFGTAKDGEGGHTTDDDSLYPLLVYDKLNGIVEIVGGEYEILDTGISG